MDRPLPLQQCTSHLLMSITSMKALLVAPYSVLVLVLKTPVCLIDLSGSICANSKVWRGPLLCVWWAIITSVDPLTACLLLPVIINHQRYPSMYCSVGTIMRRQVIVSFDDDNDCV